MTLLSLVITLVLVGVGLWLLNTYCSSFIDAKLLKIINIVVVVIVVLWLITSVFGLVPFGNIAVPRAHNG